ncbi:MAG: hypothetical protein HN704_12745 [Bacteroidetes bacterium]|jgi:hypothetical protein|nr:hypothetical protein [Bacteroidota bacterium]MBT6688106.1 hypothetical protein [Bacteroidota bacterium]MBT7144719.1 hypothetical protein [Bacteroidota bacterium]MBT7492462.1 hypothetical protein [Bacteroidota bacterium]
MKKAPILFFLSFFLFNFSFPQHPQWDWAKSFGSIDSDVGNAICSDKFGNIYITGYYNNSITFGNNTFTSAYYDNPFVVKLNSEGNIIWAKAFYGSYFVRGYDICCDTTCNVYVSGIFNNIIMTETDTFLTYGEDDVFLIKYDSIGVEQWIKHIGGDDDDFSTDIAVTNKSILITGGFKSQQLYVCSDTFHLTGSCDIFTYKLSLDGNMIWANNVGGYEYDRGWGITSDKLGNVYVAGYFHSQTINFGNISLSNSGDADFFLAKHNADGVFVWVKQAYGLMKDRGRTIACDNNNNIIVAGNFNSDILCFDSTNYIVHNSIYPQTFIVKYDSLGQIMWIQNPINHNQGVINICLDYMDGYTGAS